MDRSRDFFIERLLSDLLIGRIESHDELHGRADFLRVEFTHRFYACVIITIIDSSVLMAEGGWQKLQSAYLSIEEIAREFWKDEVWRVRVERDALILLLGTDDEKLRGLEKLDREIKQYLNVSVVVAAGDCVSLIYVWQSYKRAHLALENFADDMPGLIDYSDIPALRDMRFIIPTEKENQLIDSCLRGDDDVVIKKKLAALLTPPEGGEYSHGQIRGEVTVVYGMISRKAMELGVDIPQVIMPEWHAAPTEIEYWLFEALVSIKNSIRTARRGHIREMVDLANSFLDEHFCEYNLSLTMVSDYLKTNPSYFSRIYKRETGVNFVDALTSMRIEKAKALLRDNGERISNIAYSVGYQNSKYFAGLFRRYVGCSPSEYRERNSGRTSTL